MLSGFCRQIIHVQNSAFTLALLILWFPLGALRLPIVAVLGAIAIQTFLVTAGGILVGRKISQRLGMQTSRLAGLAAGAAFVLLGSYLILERIFSQSNLP